MPLRPRTPLHDFVDRLYTATVVLVVGLAGVLVAALLFHQSVLLHALNPLERPWLILAATALYVAVSAVRSHLRGSIFPDEPPRHVRFQEDGASGFSYHSFWSRRYGCEEGLEVIVTDSELWTRYGLWARWLFGGPWRGLENRIPLGVICAATGTGWGLRRQILIDYYDASGTPQRLALRVWNRKGLLAALRAGNPRMRISDDE
jgi:hypothetical protein